MIHNNVKLSLSDLDKDITISIEKEFIIIVMYTTVAWNMYIIISIERV